MPPKKNTAASAATRRTAKLSAADFFKPAKPSTSLRTNSSKSLNQKTPPVVIQPAAGRRSLSDPAVATPANRKHPTPNTDKDDDGFGDELDLNGIASDDDNFFGDLMNRTVKDRPLSFKDLDSIAQTELKTGTRQEDVNEILLRQFDLKSKYGPCLGLTRLERWERAYQLDLNPPKEIKDLLGKAKNLNTPLFAGQV